MSHTSTKKEGKKMVLCGTLVPVYYSSDGLFELHHENWKIPLRVSGELAALAKKCRWDDVEIVCRLDKGKYEVLSMHRKDAAEELDHAPQVSSRIDEDASAWIDRYGFLEPAVGA